MAELPQFNTLFSLDGKVALVTGGKWTNRAEMLRESTIVDAAS